MGGGGDRVSQPEPEPVLDPVPKSQPVRIQSAVPIRSPIPSAISIQPQSPSPSAPRGAGQVRSKSVPGPFSFTGSAARPSAGTHETGCRVPRPGPRGPLLRSAPLRSVPGPRPLGLAVLRPLSPGAWIDLVALASGSRNRPASTARQPIPGARARPPLALAHTRTARARRRRGLGILSKFPADRAQDPRSPCPRRSPGLPAQQAGVRVQPA